MSEAQILLPAIRAIAWRVNLAIWLNRALAPLGLALGGFAAALLAAKMAWPAAVPYTLGLLAAVPILLIRSYLECRRRGLFFRRAEVVEVLDHLYKDDGALSAAYENPALLPGEELYPGALAEVAGRLPRLQLGYYLRRAAPLAFFLVAALLVPSRPPAATPQSEAILSSITQPLFDTLAENEQLLPEEQAKELLKEAEEIRKSEEGISKEKWEAVEEMQQRIDAAVAQSQQNLSGAVASLSRLSEMMDAAGNIQGEADSQAKMQDLLKDLQQSMQDPKTNLPGGMKKEIRDLANQAGQGKLNSAELKKRLAELQKKMPQCSKCGGNCPNGQCNGQGKGKPKDGDGNPGRGGINRGRGDAELTFGEEKRVDEAQYKPQEVQNQFLSGEDMVDMGITPIEPKPDPGKFSPGAVRSFGAQEGAQVSRTRISPTQKDVIAKYFSEQE